MPSLKNQAKPVLINLNTKDDLSDDSCDKVPVRDTSSRGPRTIVNQKVKETEPVMAKVLPGITETKKH